MKNSGLFFVLFGIFVSLSGCRGSSLEGSQSVFKATFSINEVIENNKQLLLDEAWHSSGAESGPNGLLKQFHQETVVQINPENASAFMATLRSDIKKSIINSGAKILGSEAGSNGIQHFSFGYSLYEFQGTIHIWGIPGKDTNFTIISLITEN